VAIFLFVTTLHAQQQYTVDGTQYSLNTEIDGNLTLLWNVIDGEYRYFSKKGNDIKELKNTKVDGKYQEEYKEILRSQTSDASLDLAKVKFTRPSLSKFFVTYNKATDPSFTHEETAVKIQLRLGAFAGISNNVYSDNPDNEIAPVGGLDLEILDEVKLKRHAVVIRFRQAFEHGTTKFSSQLSMNYRFKFVKTPKLDVFINTKFVAWTYSKREIPVSITVGGSTTTSIVEKTGGNFNAPAAFGLGADYAVGNGYITLQYNDIVALGVSSQDDNFPVDFTLGYKFNL
jgi:hypothetical protein